MSISNWRVELPFPGDLSERESAVCYQYEDENGVTINVFSEENALAYLLLDEAVFVNSYHWKKDWPEDIQKATYMGVICNDVFAWGCADCEELKYEEIEEVYRMWARDREWGAAVWCIQRRGYMPQKPVEKRIRDAGIWDLDSMNLRPNGTI